MRHLFVAKFFEPSYAKALTNHFERPDPCGVVLALGDTKGRFSVIRTGLFFLSHGLAIRRLLLSVTPENAPEGTLAPADGSEHSQPRDEPRTGWSGAARPAPPKHQAAASPLECRFELPRSGPRGTPALGRDFRGWSGSGVIRRRGNGRGRRGCFSPGSSATTHLCGIVASDLSPQYWRQSRVLFLLLMGSPIIGPPKRTRKKPRNLVVPPVASGASSISMPSTRPFTAPAVCRTFAAFREGRAGGVTIGAAKD